MKANGWSTNEKFDYSGVTTEAPPPPEEGLYKAKISLAAPQPTKEGKPMIKLTVKLFEDSKGQELERKATVSDFVVLSQDTRFRIKALAEALDIEPLENSSLECTEEFCRDIVTAAKSGVFVKIKHKAYTDREGNEKVAACIACYMSEAKVAEESSSKESNGASSAPLRRPRGGKTETATA